MMHTWHNSLIVLFIGVLMATIGLSYGQTVTVTGPPAVEQGTNTVYTCTLTGGSPSPTLIWRDLSVNPNVIMFIGENPEEDFPEYANFDVSVNGATSTMTITNTVIEDEGVYRCTVRSIGDEQSLAVEVEHTLLLDVPNPLVNDNIYTATCEALNGRPEVTITWTLGDGGSPCENVDETPLTAPTDLFSKRSVCTFQALTENNGETLRCIISGHQLASLNGEETAALNIHSAPVSTGIITVGFQFQGPNLGVSCVIADEDQPYPIITNYYMFSNDTLIHQSSTGVNFVVVAEANFATDFLCVAGNYLGNTTSPVATYDPSS